MPASTQRWNTKILLAKIETNYGTDSAPAAATDAILARDISLTPMEGSDVSRELEMPWMGNDTTLVAELHMKLSFRVEFAASGTAGTAPRWGALMRACGCAQVISTGVSVTYNPVTDNHESVSFWLWIGGTRYVMRGVRGNFRIEIAASGIPYIAFDFWGLFSQPDDLGRPAPTLTAWPLPQIASNANTPQLTTSGFEPILRNLTFDLGNTVEPRLLINNEEIWITDRAETVEWQIEAVPLNTWNPFALTQAKVQLNSGLVHGTGAGRVCTLNLPRLELQRPQVTGAQNVKEWSLRGIPIPNTGNDQWTLVLT
jgi:hypothetical protein